MFLYRETVKNTVPCPDYENAFSYIFRFVGWFLYNLEEIMKFSVFGYDINMTVNPSTNALSSSQKSSKLLKTSNSIPSEEIQDEFLSRVRSFFGDAGLEKLRNSFVIVSFILFCLLSIDHPP